MPVRYLLALATMKSGPPSVDEVEYLRARYATIVCGACSFALMLAFPLVLRRRVDKLRRARARWQKVRYAIKVHFAISHHAAAHVPRSCSSARSTPELLTVRGRCRCRAISRSWDWSSIQLSPRDGREMTGWMW